jgi:outer membrane receptor protein involved in Fe transport
MKPRANHRPTPRLLAVALATCVLALGAPAVFAQSTSATLRGAATASAKVTATNTATGLSRSATADANGNYVLGGLPPGTYRVDVEGGTAKTVTLSVGQNATLNVGGGPTTLQVVEVIGAAQAETRTSEVATYVSPKKIDALPQTSRNFLSFADTVPGVIFDQSADDSTKLRSGAQNSNGINVFIDGVGQKNYVTKGGVSGQDSSRGNPFPQLAIGEYKVITSNYKAEYDQIGSAAVTAVTKSGTNDFGGSFFWDRSSDHWRARTPREEDADVEADSHTEQWGMSVGGPIIKDELFYFVTYEGKDITSPRTVSPGQMPPGFALPANLLALTGPTGSPFTEDLWFGKLTWQPGDDNLFELSLKKRDETEITNVDGVNTFDYGTSKTNDSTRVDLRWQYNQENWLNDAHITYEDEEWSPHATTIGPGLIFTGTAGNQDGVVLNTGGGRDFQDKGQKGWSLQDDFTFFGFEGHTMKMGFKYKTIDINAFEQQPYNPQYFIDLPTQILLGNTGPSTYQPWRVQFGSVIPGAPSRDITTSNKQFGIYFQDDWQVTEKLLLNLGLRWDYERSPGYENYVTPPNLVAALRAWPNLHGPNVDYNIENYISNGNNRDAFKDAWQPRLGFSYDLFADQRHVIFGGAGRTYDRNLWDYLALEQSKSTFPQYEFRFDTLDHPCTAGTGNCLGPWNPAFYDPNQLNALVAANPNLGAEVNLINNDIKTPYSDQFSLGMRNSFGMWNQDWTVSTTFVRIESHDGIIFSLGNRYPDGSFRDPAFPAATWGHLPFGFPIPGFGTLIKADNGVETKLNQFLLGLEKGYTTDSPWSVSVAYTYSDASENRPNAANSDEHYLFDYPNLDNQRFLMSAGVPEHRLVVSGFADIWWDMTLSGKLTLASPYPKDSTNCHAIGFENCFFDEFVPPGDIGYKTLDMSLRKSFNTGTSFTPWVRVDVINLLNWKNWTDYDTWRGGPLPDSNENFGEVNGFGINGYTRTWKLSIGFDF